MNWPDYDAALVRRGDLTVWLTEEAVAAWHAPLSGKRGGQPVYSDPAIETGLALRLVLHLPLCQTEGALRSIIGMLGATIKVPDHTIFSRRSAGLAILPQRIGRNEPVHLLIDSTGLKIYGEGEWLDQKHGIRARRRWRKLHIAVDANSQEIIASDFTADDVGDATALLDLLDQSARRSAPRSLMAPMTDNLSMMPWRRAIPKPMLSFRLARPLSQLKPRQASGTGTSRGSRSMAAEGGKSKIATVAAASLRPPCSATRRSLDGASTPGLCRTSRPRPRLRASSSTR
jgi:hypothetical protein